MTTSASRTAFTVLIAVSVSHLLNDLLQSLLPAIYPLFKAKFDLDFLHIGLIALANQLTASLLQPVVGYFTDKRPQPYSLAIGMTATMSGLLLLAVASHFGWILAAAALIGVGSAIFHPESSRIARAASGGRHGFAQSFFQTGGNAGSSLGPLLAAFIVAPRGQGSIAWFSVIAVVAIVILWRVGAWYVAHRHASRGRDSASGGTGPPARRGPSRHGHSAHPRLLEVTCTSRASRATSRSSSFTSFRFPCRPHSCISSAFWQASRRARSRAGRLAIASGARR